MTPETKYCIIHAWCVDLDREIGLSKEQKAAAEEAWRTIEKIRSKCSNVVELPHGSPTLVKAQFNSGDTAILCGAYRGACLQTAARTLEEMGVTVLHHRIASLPMNVREEKGSGVAFFDENTSS